jgi:hypothetical protein
MAEYYQKYFPRHDLFDGSIIKFKNKEQYFSTDFNTVSTLRKWLDTKPANEVREYCGNLLTKRKIKKNLTYALSQVELRSLKFPGVNYYNKVFGNYYEFCKELGFKNKFKKSEKLSYSIYDNSFNILVDTREQQPLKLNRPIEIATLKFGDYTFSKREAVCDAYIERKSLSDFIGTLTGGYERFEREIVRAKEAGAYLVVLVEDTLTNALKFNFLPYIYKKGMKITPDFVFRRVRDLIQKYDHIQFLFVENRAEAAKVIEKIFTCNCEYRDVDLQYMYDNKFL